MIVKDIILIRVHMYMENVPMVILTDMTPTPVKMYMENVPMVI
jgi:hypothetical protein